MKWYTTLITALVAIAATGAIALADSGGLAASFTTDVTNGAAPLTVLFMDTSTGNPTGWQWNFGDGSQNVTDQNPTYTFQSPGTYTVTLTVTDGTNVDSTTSDIVVEPAATATPAGTLYASFVPDRTDGIAPLTVQFTDTSTGNVAGWQWDFGDGSQNDTGQNPAHTYQVPGVYTVTLTVTDGDQYSAATDQIIVESPTTTADQGTTATPSPALPATVTVLTLIVASGMALYMRKAGKK